MLLKQLKVLLIDPWGIKETGEYTRGLCSGLSQLTELTLITNSYHVDTSDAQYHVLPWFFPVSEELKCGIKRTAIRGLEYINTYMRIISLVKRERFDVVHVNWLLMYKADCFFLRRMKKYCGKIVYTAHNVIPHIAGETKVEDLRKIYGIVDSIILHGNNIKEEFTRYFSGYENKVYIQKHGCNLRSERQFDLDAIEKGIIEKVNAYSKRYIAFGRLDESKGVDRAVDYWLSSNSARDALLIIAGKPHSGYIALKERMAAIAASNNILFLGEYVSDNLLNYLVSASDLILLLYRHASMSGAIFTAADFSKPILCTEVGAFCEYLTDGKECFFAANDDKSVATALDQIINTVSSDTLIEMGKNLHNRIRNECNWYHVTEGIVREVYNSYVSTTCAREINQEMTK